MALCYQGLWAVSAATVPDRKLHLPVGRSRLTCQDSSLLFSAASALRPALPFVLLTNDHNYITAYTLQSATTPADVVIGKYFYKQHVEDITQELHEAQGLGQAAAEEWYKGLQTRGKERMKLAENWERWEVKQQWLDEHQDAKRATSVAPSVAPSVAATSHREPSRSPPRHVSSPVIHAPVPASKYDLRFHLLLNAAALRHVSTTPLQCPT